MSQRAPCRYCLSDLMREKLGRCSRCMWLSCMGALLCWAIYNLWLRDTTHSVEAIATLLFAILLSLLYALHLIAWCWYRWQNKRR